MLPFAKTVFAFIGRWWGVESPVGTAELIDEFYESGTGYISQNGVSGFNNENNDNFIMANEMWKEAEGNSARIRRIIK